MESRCKKVQQQLVALGYNYCLNVDSLLLVEKLVEDLIETTENLRKYMRIAQEVIEERDTLKFGAEPYKCDNARLTQQCNDLHLTFIDCQENHAKEVKELKKTITQLSKDKEDCITSNKRQRERIRELELVAVRKGARPSASNTNISANKKSKEFETAMALTEQKVSNLTREVCRLKQHQLELCTINDELKQKLTHREKEIQRLSRLLEGGRPIEALNSECCYQDVSRQLLSKQDEVNYLQKSHCELELKLKEARNKQHEAMKHALHLAERNSQLERELRDIDQMALAVEQECNDSLKTNDVKAKKLQDRLQSTMIELQSTEQELQALKIDREQFRADLDAANIEKGHLQGVLEGALEDKKRLSDRFNNFTAIEQSLNQEIERFVQQTADQTRQIAELKGQLMAQRAHYESGNEQPRIPGTRNKEHKQSKKHKSPSPTRRGVKSTRLQHKLQSKLHVEGGVPANSPVTDHSPTELEEQIAVTNYSSYKNIDPQYMVRLQSERDFYVREYKALLEKIRKDMPGVADRLNYNISISNSNINKNSNENLCNFNGFDAGDRVDTGKQNVGGSRSNTSVRNLQEQITQLQHDNQNLSKEKHNLLMRLENVRDYSDATEYLTLKASSKRLERERDILKADVDRMEEERDSMKHRLKVSGELHSSEIERYKKLLAENEEQLRRLEKERYDILQSQGSRRATVVNLEDHVDTLKEQLKSSQDELIHQKTIYSQIKVLHEQTDRALADSQNQLGELERQLASHEQKHDDFDNKTTTLSKEIQRLKQDIELLTKNLVAVEREKDTLLLQVDEKTEKIVELQEQLHHKSQEVDELKQHSSELRYKFSATLDDKNTKDCQLKSKSNDIKQLQRDLEQALKFKENLIAENKRLQDELASYLLDNRKVRSDLEVARRQITDLKMQLQHYCGEVKRIEDMMTQKEVERSEMLDQFRSLSHEATALESSNHSLETEATQSKLQLSVALDHAGELEHIIAQQKTLISNYEKQIAELTSQIATMEMQIKHGQLQHERTAMEIGSLRELCAKLDKQKDEMGRKVSEREFLAARAQSELESAMRNQELTNMTIEKEQSSTRSLENLLGDTRQELVEQRLINEDLQGEIVKLKGQLTELEENLLRVKLLAKDLCAFFSNSSGLNALGDEMRKTLENVYSEATTIPSEMSDFCETAPIIPDPGEPEVEHYDSTSEIDVDEFKQLVTARGKKNQEQNTSHKKACICQKTKVASGSQTNKSDYKRAS